MRFINTVILLLLSVILVRGQQYGNEWINYGWQYYKVTLTQNGIYRITTQQLAEAGFPVNNTDPRRIKVFGRGEEQPVYIQGESDGSFDAGDFIEFYAEGNDGWFDTRLFESPDLQGNPNFSMFNDTAVYFIAITNSTTGHLRYQNETPTDYNNFQKSPYYWLTSERPSGNTFHHGFLAQNIQINPDYGPGKGYATFFNNPTTHNQPWSGWLDNVRNTIFTLGPPSTLELRMSGANNPVAGFDHRWVIQAAGSVLLDTSLNAFDYAKLTYSLNSAQLNLANNAYSISFLSTFSSNSRNALIYAKLRTPQVYDLSGRTQLLMEIPDNAIQSKYDITISNFNSLNTVVRLYDITNRKRITMTQEGSTFRASISNGGGIKKVYLASESQVRDVLSIRPIVNPVNGTPTFRNFVTEIKDFDYLIFTHKTLWTVGQQYRNYRTLTGYNALLLDVDEIYEQFGYGIPKHPLALKNFIMYAFNNWQNKPKFVLMFGKGIKSTDNRFNNNAYVATLVPGLGVNATDNLYGYNFDGNKRFHIPVGRVAATNNSEAASYLEKVKQQESNAPALWMKNIMHFAGGLNVQEQNTHLAYLNSYKDLIEDTLFGGFVRTIKKSSTAPVQTSMADSIRNLINNEGVSLMTFFAHAAGFGFDISIDDPSSYTNTGKYPIILANSCFAGDLFIINRTIGENFVLEPNRAAIAFIGTSSTSFPSVLNNISRRFYENLSFRFYNQPIGKSLIDACNRAVETFTAPVVIFTVLEMMIHGDPALRINTSPLTDYSISEPQVYFTPGNVTSELDSFEVNIIVENLGRTDTNQVLVEITRDFPRAGTPNAIYTQQFPPIFYKDTLVMKLPLDPVNGLGENILYINIDPGNIVKEVTKVNNFTTKKLVIRSADIVPVFPPEFAVIPNNSVVLKASTGDPFAPLRTYKLEIDTTDTFNSPFKQDTTVTQTGGVVKWKPTLLSSDSTVYFWRAGVDSSGTGFFHRWKESSFQYIQGKRGWGQSHFFQYKDNNYVYINHNRNIRKFEFVPNVKNLRVRNIGSANTPAQWTNIGYEIDGALMESNGCGTAPAIHVAVIDPITLTPWATRCNGQNLNNNFGNANDNCACRPRPENYFIFRPNNQASLNNMVNMINNVPNDHYIIVYTWVNGLFGNWTNNQITALEDLGADSLRFLAQNSLNRPYIFYVRKGDVSSAIEVIGAESNSVIELNAPLENNWTFGTMTTQLVGPASKWHSFHWKNIRTQGDSVFASIIGVTAGGSEQILFSNIDPSTTEITELHNSINAGQFPFLKLRFFTRNDEFAKPTQLSWWHVLHEGVPEAALNPTIDFAFKSDSLQMGEMLQFRTAIENIGEYDMDSLVIRYFVIDQNNQTTQFFQKRDSLRVGQYITDSFNLNTINYTGLNSFWVEVNPFNHPGRQPELFHFNNLGQINFKVLSDRINPMLDVTFDGRHIMDGEIVSTNPEILIKLKDENPLLPIADTTSFDIFLIRPGGVLERLNFGMPEIQFFPASLPENVARIEFRPDFKGKDGIYELKLRARDASGNSSGKGDGVFDYKIRFEVISKSTITDVLNYPNPFSTSTRFVFTLTGNDIPTFMKIQIYTLDGRIVREIMMEELGTIRIGKNITEFAWNGTDEFGDKLASGVYLYRVITNIDGKEIEKRETRASDFFHKGFGKMYLMR